MAESYRFMVSGRVQGVFFRQSAADLAQSLQLRGWIGNRADGQVEGRVSGEPAALQRFRDWLSKGPPAARVEQVAWEPAPPPTETGFMVRRGTL